MSNTLSQSNRWPFVLAAVVVLTIAATITDDAVRLEGDKIDFGAGSVSTYAELGPSGAPEVLGVQFTPEGLESPPDAMSDLKHCVDRNEDGSIDLAAVSSVVREIAALIPNARVDRPVIVVKSTVVPGTVARWVWASSKRLRSQTVTRSGRPVERYFPGSSLVMMISATPWVRRTVTISGTVNWPCGSWPPVMAMAWL